LEDEKQLKIYEIFEDLDFFLLRDFDWSSLADLLLLLLLEETYSVA
jgi:hypothetical protein